MTRRPVALTSWKMSMTIAESLAWAQEFTALAAGLLEVVDVVVSPPFTALWAVHQALQGHRIQLAAQNMAPAKDLARTGEISAVLLKDVGCDRVLLGHWEVRRHLGDDDEAVRRKVRLALEVGLAPILLIGEARDEDSRRTEALRDQLEGILGGCEAQDVETMILIYEPEASIGKTAPLPPQQAAAGCAFMRRWIAEQWGARIADRVRVMYGGSVAPEFAADLLACPEIDGLGTTRRGRDAETFADIVQQVARAKTGWTD
jgi:triosephosphate isomerase